MRVFSTILLALTAVFTANADLMSSTGQVSVIAPPASVVVNSGLESNSLAYFYTEKRDFTLGSTVTVDAHGAGLYNSNATLNGGTIASGTVVDSYYLHADPVGEPTATFLYDGSVTFDTNILGIIVLDPEFAASNGQLGHTGTLYSASGQGLELGGPDTVTLTVTGETLSFHFGTSTAADDIRILTAASVPEPSASILLLTCVGLCFVVLRKRRTPARNL